MRKVVCFLLLFLTISSYGQRLGVVASSRHVSEGGSSTLNNGLIVCLELNETSGTTAVDASGSHNFTNHGATVNQSGKIGTSYSFNSNFLEPATTTAFQLTNVSVSVWIYTSSSDYTTSGIVCFREGSDGDGYELIENGEWGIDGDYGEADFALGDAGGTNYYELFSTSKINGGAWHQVVGTFDGTNQRIYVDGSLQASNTWSHTISYPSGVRFLIGARTVWGDNDENYVLPYVGRIDAVRVWNRALTGTEITELYTKENAGTTYPWN
jgi:hypothetical protein